MRASKNFQLRIVFSLDFWDEKFISDSVPILCTTLVKYVPKRCGRKEKLGPRKQGKNIWFRKEKKKQPNY